MPINTEILLYYLAKTFNTTLGVNMSNETSAYLKKKSKICTTMDKEEKFYYAKYALKLVEALDKYLKDISFFEIKIDDDEEEIVHDFKLTWGEKNVVHISMNHNSINTRDIIPEKIMKICKYKRNTNICKEYTERYNKLNNKIYQKISSNEKYSEINDKTKRKFIYEPLCQLVMDIISKKRKCAEYLYNHLFDESDRIVLKLYKNRFVVYDFDKEIDEVEGFRMKYNGENIITVTFNNDACFDLVLHTNATEIKEHISVKFRNTFKNIDEIFAVEFGTI